MEGGKGKKVRTAHDKYIYNITSEPNFKFYWHYYSSSSHTGNPPYRTNSKAGGAFFVCVLVHVVVGDVLTYLVDTEA